MKDTNADGIDSPSATQQATWTPSHFPPTTASSSAGNTPTRMTAEKLAERDRQAVAYSRAQLREGDTLVIIQYPENCEIFDSTGFRMEGQRFRVHSEKLLATGSAKFSKLLSKWEQSKAVRRNGFSKGLPIGIKYVLDLTPPNEGDEAVDLLSELSCSMGIRHWYTAEQRLKVPADVCGGRDEVVKPAKPKSPQKSHGDLVDALADLNFEPEIRSLTDVPNQPLDKEEVDSLAQRSSGGTFKEQDDRELEEVLERSKREFFNSQASSSTCDSDGYKHVKDVPEYCSVRHRVGIEKLLQLIEGKDPRLDSAPKVWTLSVLAKYFDCTNVVIDFIVCWCLRQPNCQIIEILPEVTLKMGLGLKTPILTRPAFAILVSEYALSFVARECRDPHAINVNINQFGRAREDIDEDVMNGIQAAAYSLVARVEKMWDAFCAPEMGWLVELPEYRKLATFGEWIRDSALDEPLMQSIQANIASLKSSLSHFVRGQIIWAVNRQLTFEEDTDANAHRRSETYLQNYISDFGVCIYLPLSEKERLLTTFPYKILGSMSFGVDNPSNRLLDTGGVAAWDVKRNEKAAANHGVHRVWTKTLVKMVFELNQKILMTIENHEFNSGSVPTECFFRRGTRRDNVEDPLDESDVASSEEGGDEASDDVDPRVPDDINIQERSPFFSLRIFAKQVQSHVQLFANSMLRKDPDLDFTALNDTLLCLTDDEWKYLPLWAGGSNDGSGGVFGAMVPPAPPGAGPSGPGPAYHTGYSMASQESTELDFGGTSLTGVDTSVAVEDGHASHIDRRQVVSESDFQSETFTDTTEQYNCARLNDDNESTPKAKGKGRVRDFEESTEAPIEPNRSTTPELDDHEEPEWDAEEEEEPFDYGDEPEEDDADDETGVSFQRVT